MELLSRCRKAQPISKENGVTRSVTTIMAKKVPGLGIILNSRSRQCAMWVKDPGSENLGRWLHIYEYNLLEGFADSLRQPLWEPEANLQAVEERIQECVFRNFEPTDTFDCKQGMDLQE